MNKEKSSAQELAELINCHGIDNDLNTPDWVLANLLVSTLNAQNELQVAAADGVRNDDPDDDDVCNCPACTLRRAMEAKGTARPEGKREYRKPQAFDVPKEVADITEIIAELFPGAKVELHRIDVPRNNPRNRRRNKNKRKGGRNNETR